MHLLPTFFNKYGTKKNIVIGVLLIFIFNVVLFPKFTELFLGTKIAITSILDIKCSYTTATAYALFSNLGKEGRYAYKISELFIDIPYAIIYGLTYTFILNSFNKMKNYKYLIFIPLFISFFDLLENTGIIVMLTKYPTKLATICNLTSIFTSLKWIFAIITLALFLTNLGYLLISKVFLKKYNL